MNDVILSTILFLEVTPQGCKLDQLGQASQVSQVRLFGLGQGWLQKIVFYRVSDEMSKI